MPGQDPAGTLAAPDGVANRGARQGCWQGCWEGLCCIHKQLRKWLNDGAGAGAFLTSAIFIWLPIIVALVDNYGDDGVLARQSGLIALLGQLVGTVFTVMQCVGSSRKVRDPGAYLAVVVVLWVICMIFSCVTAKLYTRRGGAEASPPPAPQATAAPTTEGEGSAQQMLTALLSGQSDVYNAFVALLAASNSAYVGMYSMLCTTEVAHTAEKKVRDRLEAKQARKRSRTTGDESGGHHSGPADARAETDEAVAEGAAGAGNNDTGSGGDERPFSPMA
eukprot:TRINITY_DN13592_c0_g1_i1.p1 TRINITY_DN13592_c0_g1~~TRINITY_DN13592_c0_g1_i1.p1  ORF type:complete len:277 (-),score=58.11 TRINITY_DN13592_c0_g1_i1:202-1032(-)